MELAPPRGTQDLLPDRADAMLGLYEEAHRVARLYGYRYVETPTFEQTELFARTSGATSDVVTKEMYTFEDKGGRSVTLRPESTAGVVRAYLAHGQSLPNPFKGYYVASQFRHGRPQAGRMREFRQFGVEVIGTGAPGADVEVIEIGDRFLAGRGLADVTLHLNSIGDEACRPAYRDELVAYFRPFRDRLDAECRDRLDRNPLRVFDCKVDGERDFVRAAPTIADRLCDPCAEHFAAVRDGLDRAGVGYVLDPRLVRGLDYYTRTTFEWISGVLAANKAGTLNAGGRYDGLAEELGGPATPGVGFALGLDRVLLAMEAEGLALPPARTPTGFVVAIGDGAGPAGASLVDELRSAGIAAVHALEERPLKAQLKMADRAGASFTAIVGEREAAEGVVTLRRLADGVQQQVPRADVVRWLSRLADPDDRTEGHA
ncbi:MAG TPA: histidine--tRNA ligase [Actinomycetota bacterium]|nr:histidine--tRNA ligase [Actinomycetota bacterium]